MRGREHYQLKINQFKSDRKGGLQFFRYVSKNNQREIKPILFQYLLIIIDHVQIFNCIYLNVHFQLMKISICSLIHLS